MGCLGLLSLAQNLLHLEHSEEDDVDGVPEVDIPVVAAAARVYLVRHHLLRGEAFRQQLRQG